LRSLAKPRVLRAIHLERFLHWLASEIERKIAMYSFARTLSLFALTAFGLLTTVGGCSSINEAMDCDQLCEKMEVCIDSDLDVHDCAEKCEDRVDDSALADKLDSCTDCLDSGRSCNEAVDECPVCDEVQMALFP
jgi:hypothetical protein